MEQYLPKAAVVAEIKRLLSAFENSDAPVDRLRASILIGLLSFINTLEVKEVNLEKEIEKHLKACLDVKFPTTDIDLIKKDVAYTAKKFFELGIQQSKNHNNNEE